MLTARFRYKPSNISKYIDKKSLLLMDGPKIIEENMSKASVSHGELYAELRKAGVIQLRQVKAAVLETTGEVSVLTHPDPSLELDALLLSEVRK